MAADGVVDSCVTGSKRSHRQRQTFKNAAADTVCLGGGEGFQPWFLTYFNSKPFFTSQVHNQQYVHRQSVAD